MKIITFFEDLTKQWNDENKCNECWSFGSPLSESGLNATKKNDDEKCCVHLFLTYFKKSSGYSKNNNTGLNNREWCDSIFTLYVLKNSRLDLNIYNEEPNHPIDESIWKTILDPLENCIGCGNEIELCELGYNFEITKWDMEVVKRYEDSNYAGWKINGIFRQYF